MNATTKTPAIDATIEDSVLRLVFANGQHIEFNANGLREEIRQAALMHGLKQKLVDAAAISRNPDTGRSASVEDKYHAVYEVYERLLAGEWNKRREGGGGATGGLLLQALVRLYVGRKTEAELRAWLADKTDAEQAKLRADSRVAPIIAEIKAERDARKAKDAGISGDDLLGELDNEAPL